MEKSNRSNFKGRRGHERSIEEKFWDYVVIRDGCWGWSGARMHYGYPQLAPLKSKRAKRSKTAGEAPLRGHRVSWELHNGPIPEGKLVLHKCDNTICTNPDHLYLGTQTENTKDAWDRGRRKTKRHYSADGKVLCKYGHEKILITGFTNKYVCRTCQRLRFKAKNRLVEETVHNIASSEGKER